MGYRKCALRARAWRLAASLLLFGLLLSVGFGESSPAVSSASASAAGAGERAKVKCARKRAGCTPTPGPTATSTPPTSAGPALPLFRRPFVGDFPVSNFFDHDLPFEFEDNNGFLLTAWGSRTVGVDGHNGYDWLLPEATPLLAPADGTVTFAGQEVAFRCPSLGGRLVAGLGLIVEHRAAGETIQSVFAHLGRIDVQSGQAVRQGQQLGLSGNSGCSTGPHLHFGARRFVAARQAFVDVDPYGWEAAAPDPWARHPEGAQSLRLWQPNQAPALFREVELSPNPSGSNAPVTITRVRWMGADDDRSPNNEFVELTLDPRYAPKAQLSLSGFKLRNNRGDRFSFPSRSTIAAGEPLRIYSGPGSDGAAALYWGRNSGGWDDLGDCAHLDFPQGGSYVVSFGGAGC